MNKVAFIAAALGVLGISDKSQACNNENIVAEEPRTEDSTAIKAARSINYLGKQGLLISDQDDELAINSDLTNLLVEKGLLDFENSAHSGKTGDWQDP